MKKILFSALLTVVGILGASQLVYADSSILAVSPSSGTKTVGSSFNVSVRLNPSSNDVCLASGTLSFGNLTCQNITLAGGVMAQQAPTCADPTFDLGIPDCTTAAQNLFSVSAAGKKAGKASLSIAGIENIGPTGADVPSGATNGAYTIVAAKASTTPNTVPPVTTPPPSLVGQVTPPPTPPPPVTTPTPPPTPQVNGNTSASGQQASLATASPTKTIVISVIVLLVIIIVGGTWYALTKRKKNKKS
jgi:hypothetical protein